MSLLIPRALLPTKNKFSFHRLTDHLRSHRKSNGSSHLLDSELFPRDLRFMWVTLPAFVNYPRPLPLPFRFEDINSVRLGRAVPPVRILWLEARLLSEYRIRVFRNLTHNRHFDISDKWAFFSIFLIGGSDSSLISQSTCRHCWGSRGLWRSG